MVAHELKDLLQVTEDFPGTDGIVHSNESKTPRVPGGWKLAHQTYYRPRKDEGCGSPCKHLLASPYLLALRSGKMTGSTGKNKRRVVRICSSNIPSPKLRAVKSNEPQGQQFQKSLAIVEKTEVIVTAYEATGEGSVR